MEQSLMLVIILVVMAVMLFFTSRSSRNRQRQQETYRKSITKGDVVMTASGLIGVIEGVDLQNNSVIINSEGTKTRWIIESVTKLPNSIDSKVITGGSSAKSNATSSETAVSEKPATTKKPAAKKIAVKKK